VRIGEALLEARRLLEAAGSDEAPVEAELLLMHALKIDRATLYRRLGDDLPPAESAGFQRLLDRCLAHEPVPYITGHKEFFGLDFEVAPAALIPRGDTEPLVELAIHFARERDPFDPIAIADIGTGSGAIAVSLAVELPNAIIVATDLSPDALEVARRNAERHGVLRQITLMRADLFSDNAPQAFDIIAANLPYVTTAEWEALPPEIRHHEPRAALDGGPDGLHIIRRLLAEAPGRLNPGGALFAEIGYEQGIAAAAIARAAFPEATVTIEPDLAGRDRVLVVR